MKKIIAGLILLLSANLSRSFAQDHNPLINSGDLISEASNLHDSGEYKQAITLYDKIDRNDTNYVRALYGKSISYTADSQYDQAIRSCKEALALETGREWEPGIYTQYGIATDAMGQSEKAIRIFDSAILKYPAYSLLYLNKGITLFRLERIKEAEAVFQQTLLIDPYSASAHFRLGLAALNQGRLIPAFLSFTAYLLIAPEGKWNKNCIALLDAISKNQDNIQAYLTNRKEEPADNYKLVEQIVQSKIALDKNYKPLLRLDDAISRQIQVVFEKLEYDENDPDFWIQYYMPLFKNILKEGKFEYFINYIFSDVNIPVIREFNKKNKKEIGLFTAEASEYFNAIRDTRELNYKKRNRDGIIWVFDPNGRILGRGKSTDNGKILTGPWEFYYYAGNLKTKGLFNEQGKKEGEWSYYFINDKLKGKEFYQDGSEEGEETFYFSDGAVSTRCRYKNNKLEGEYIFYFPIGIPKTISHYKEGKLEGEKRIFFGNGNISYVENYSADVLQGPYQSWYKSGQLEYEATYNAGKLEGPYKKYYESGKLSVEGVYSKDQQTGAWKYYHENGLLKDQQNWVDGKQEGDYKEYYEDGKLFANYQYRKGKIDGEGRYYDEDGKLYSTLQYDKDQLKTAVYLDKEGAQIGRSEQKSGTLDLTTFLPDGSKRTHAIYDQKGNNNGTETYFYQSGKTLETDEYQGGNKEGAYTSYYRNGAKKDEISYGGGKKEGYYKSYFTHGEIEQEGWYKKDQLEGYWLSYDEPGNLSSKTYFLDDEVTGYKTEYLPNGRKEFETKYKSGWLKELWQYDSTGKQLQYLDFPGGTGHYTLLYPNGKIYLDGQYVHGSLEGSYSFYYFDGALQSIQYYKKGLADSLYKSYYYGSHICVEGWFRMGMKTGTWKYYNKEGRLTQTQDYDHGKMTGKHIYYYEDGRIDTEISLRDDEKQGVTRKYDEQGLLMSQITYIDDLPVSYTFQDRTGKLLPETPIVRGAGKIKTFYTNGNPSASFEYSDGKTIGEDIQYYPNGKTRSISTEEYGHTEGSYKGYYPSGQLKWEYTYLHDNLHGPYKEYNEKGVLTEAGSFYNGSLHGIVKIYTDSGSLKETDFYYYGKLLSVKK